MSKQLSRLGQFTRPRRSALGISLGQMADAIGISSARLSTVELNEGSFPEHWIPKISILLKLSESDEAELRAIHAQHTIDKLSGAPQAFHKLLSELNAYREQIPEEGFEKMRRLARSYVGKTDPPGQENRNGTLS